MDVVARSRGVPALSYGASSVIAIQGVSSFRGAKLQVSIKKKKKWKMHIAGAEILGHNMQ